MRTTSLHNLGARASMILISALSLSACASLLDTDELEFGDGTGTAEIPFGRACTDAPEPQTNDSCEFDIDCQPPLECIINVGDVRGKCIKACIDAQQCGGVGDCVPIDDVLDAEAEDAGFCEEPFFNGDSQIACNVDNDCATFGDDLICEELNRQCHRTCLSNEECESLNCIPGRTLAR